jgi:hypothetical protein
MTKLRAADSADAIVDGLRRRRAKFYVPSSLRPPSVLDLALPRRIKRIVHRAFRSDQIAQEFDPAARADRRGGAGACRAPGATAAEIAQGTAIARSFRLQRPPSRLASAGRLRRAPKGDR